MVETLKYKQVGKVAIAKNCKLEWRYISSSPRTNAKVLFMLSMYAADFYRYYLVHDLWCYESFHLQFAQLDDNVICVFI